MNPIDRVIPTIVELRSYIYEKDEAKRFRSVFIIARSLRTRNAIGRRVKIARYRSATVLDLRPTFRHLRIGTLDRFRYTCTSRKIYGVLRSTRACMIDQLAALETITEKSTGIRLGNDMHQSTRRSTEAIRGFAEFPRFRGSPGEARLLRVLDDRWWETNVERID